MGKRAYISLRSVFKDLPSIQTLQAVLNRLPISARLNPLILRHLENIASKMSDKDKVYILMWDEVSIQPKSPMISERILYVVLRIGVITVLTKLRFTL